MELHEEPDRDSETGLQDTGFMSESTLVRHMSLFWQNSTVLKHCLNVLLKDLGFLPICVHFLLTFQLLIVFKHMYLKCKHLIVSEFINTEMARGKTQKDSKRTHFCLEM